MLKPDTMVHKAAIVTYIWSLYLEFLCKISKITENWFYNEKIAFW